MQKIAQTMKWIVYSDKKIITKWHGYNAICCITIGNMVL